MNDIVIILGEGGIAIGAGMTADKEVNNPYISFEVMRQPLKIGEKPSKDDIVTGCPRVVIDIANPESLEVLANAVDTCRKLFNEEVLR